MPQRPLFDPALMWCVNANPLPPDYAPGELLCVGPLHLQARRPGWNMARLGGDRGPWVAVADARGNPSHPAADFPPELVAVAHVDRGGWPADDADTPLAVDDRSG